MRPLEEVAAETGIDIRTVQQVAAALSKGRKLNSETVTLRHPQLPAEQVIEVDRRRAGARLAAGWKEAETEVPEPDPEPPAGPTPEPAVTESNEQPASEPEKPKRQRRTKSEEQ